jgi:hypothetical protein
VIEEHQPVCLGRVYFPKACPASQVVLLDERGKELTSEKFADMIADAGETVGGRCLRIITLYADYELLLCRL